MLGMTPAGTTIVCVVAVVCVTLLISQAMSAVTGSRRARTATAMPPRPVPDPPDRPAGSGSRGETPFDWCCADAYVTRGDRHSSDCTVEPTP